MELSVKIDELIRAYIATVEELNKKARPFDGVFGMGNDVRKDPCHMKVYEDIQAAVESAAVGGISSEEADCAAEALLKAETAYTCPSCCGMMLTALQGHIIPLAAHMSAAKREELRSWMDTSIPRRRRLPIQNTLYKALKG